MKVGDLEAEESVDTQIRLKYVCRMMLCSLSNLSSLYFSSGERPYLCIICGAAFKLLHTLNKHSKIHTKEGQAKRKKSSKFA